MARAVMAGLVQMTSVNDLGANFKTCARLVKQAKQIGCNIVFFPECASLSASSDRHVDSQLARVR